LKLAMSKKTLNSVKISGMQVTKIASHITLVIMTLVFLLIGLICFIQALAWIDKPFSGFLVNERLIVSGIGQPSWTGFRAGMRVPDKILQADNQPILTPWELEEVVRQIPEGRPITYLVEREGQLIAVKVPTMIFDIYDFFSIFGFYFITGCICGICGLLVLVMKPDTEVSWAFFLSIYFIGLYFVLNFDVIAPHKGFIRLYMVTSALFPAAACHLSLLFPEPLETIRKYPFFKIFPYLVALLFIALLEFYYPQPSIAIIYGFVTLFTLLSAATLIASALSAYFIGTSALGRQRAKVVLFGATMAFPVPAVANIFTHYGLIPTHLGVIGNPWLRLPLIIFPAAIAYAIVKHNLFDVDVYIKRTVGYAIMTALVGSAYFSMQVLFRTAVFQPLFGEYSELVYPVLLALLIVFLFNPLNRKVQDSVDRWFFRKKVDYKHTVISISDALTSLLNLDEVINRIIHTVRAEMFINPAGVVLLDSQKQRCSSLFISDKGDSTGTVVLSPHLSFSDPLLVALSRVKRMITEYDVLEIPGYLPMRESCQERFKQIGISLALPLVFQDEVKGVLMLGQKKSGHFYTGEDIELLTTLANQGAVAIENAQLAEQIKKEQTVRTNLSRYLSPQVVEDIMRKDVQVILEGDLKEVTVLISDIRDFLKMTESTPPDQLVKILNDYFTEMVRIIFEHQGSIDKYIGDSIVAVFGSLIPLRNSARNAVSAAIQMMHQMPILNEGWKNRHDIAQDVEIGIGISTGEVYLGNVGSLERMEFTIIGNAVNFASRFCGLAGSRQILITRETLDRLGPDNRVRHLPAKEVKGKKEKQEVFEILYT
jgi:class 3 adenylate cyclase